MIPWINTHQFFAETCLLAMCLLLAWLLWGVLFSRFADRNASSRRRPSILWWDFLAILGNPKSIVLVATFLFFGLAGLYFKMTGV